jgi:hypothetical protein
MSELGCPAKRIFFFRFEPKQTETLTVSVLFRHFFRKNIITSFGLFRYFKTVSKRTETAKIKVISFPFPFPSLSLQPTHFRIPLLPLPFPLPFSSPFSSPYSYPNCSELWGGSVCGSWERGRHFGGRGPQSPSKGQ